MKRFWTYIPRTRPPGAVVPTLKRGDPTVLVCPSCGGEVVTPEGWDPWTGAVQRMILLPDRTADCPHAGCGAVHWILPDVARQHNRAVYPNHPEVWEQPADIQEMN